MAQEWHRHRRNMVDELTRAGHLSDSQVRAALLSVPRHAFVSGVAQGPTAYADRALPLQGSAGPTLATASAPHVIARMLQWLMPLAGKRILEVGTGSGYNAALLAYLAGDEGAVLSVEIDCALTERALRVLSRLRPRSRPQLAVGDGAGGYPRLAPYDRVCITAAVTGLAPAWLAQLAASGRLLAPLEILPSSVGWGSPAICYPLLLRRSGARFVGRFYDYPMCFVPLRSSLVTSTLNCEILASLQATAHVAEQFDAGKGLDLRTLLVFQSMSRLEGSIESLSAAWRACGCPAVADWRLVVYLGRNYGHRLSYPWHESEQLTIGAELLPRSETP